jgi:hypothetical protein
VQNATNRQQKFVFIAHMKMGLPIVMRIKMGMVVMKNISCRL